MGVVPTSLMGNQSPYVLEEPDYGVRSMAIEQQKLPKWAKKGSLDADLLKREVSSCLSKLRSESSQQQITGGDGLYSIVSVMWTLDTRHARDAADLVCEKIRVEGGLDRILFLCSTSKDQKVIWSVLRVLEQVMVADNREYITKCKYFPAVLALARSIDSLPMVQLGTGILENLFKVSPDVSRDLLNTGALESVLLGCRYTDSVVVHHCAAALANCALFGDARIHRDMVNQHADHWLFPLAFSEDRAVKYYALISISILASHRELAEVVQQSGTLSLVLPFLRTQDPQQFAKTCYYHAHGRSASWLQRMLPLLVCESEESQSLAAFHFAMEAGIKDKQGRLKVFTDIGAVELLLTAAKDGSRLSSKFACLALELMKQPLPDYQCWNVCQWTPQQVEHWVSDIGLKGYAEQFSSHFVNGHLLIDLTMEDLQHPHGIGMASPLICKWFLKQVKELRSKADFSAEDPDHICQWLITVGPELATYKADFIRNRITKELLPQLTEELLYEIGVISRVDRLKLCLAVDEVASVSNTGRDTPDADILLHTHSSYARKKYDVFLSYRRDKGSQLASLLKVHLQLRGLRVFLDVTGLGSGKFDDALLTTISNSLNMVMVLTPGALDRCKGDDMVQDWVHRELAHAIEISTHIVPVLDNFNMPPAHSLPTDIQSLCSMNGVKWSHEYQDACVEKLVNFLQLPITSRRRSLSLVKPRGVSFNRTDSIPI